MMRHVRIAIYTIISAGLLIGAVDSANSENPATATDVKNKKGNDMSEKATFAAGCFWGVEATFRQLKGVLSTRVGYIGGSVSSPTYNQVCTDTTGHAEAVEVSYDPALLSYNDILKVFWENHDPTQVNRQGPDHGTQYRTAIFFHSSEQQKLAEESKIELEKSKRFTRPVATHVVPAVEFWPAEEYHQQYLEKRGLSSCHIKE